jgi:hypothetical protein
MAYQYEKSEDFRANMYFLSGLGFFGPFGIYITESITKKIEFDLINFFLALLFAFIGTFFIFKSYSIMLKKDER